MQTSNTRLWYQLNAQDKDILKYHRKGNRTSFVKSMCKTDAKRTKLQDKNK